MPRKPAPKATPKPAPQAPRRPSRLPAPQPSAQRPPSKPKPIAPRAPVAPAQPPSPRQAPKAAPTGPKAAPKLPTHPPAPQPRPAAPKPAPAKALPPPGPDPFDLTPSPSPYEPLMPGAYVARIQGEGDHTCIAYKRTDTKVFTVMLCPAPVHLREFGADTFDEQMRPLTLHPIGGLVTSYPLQRAVDQYLASWGGHTDKALRVLKRLRAGRPVEEEDTLDELLDTTPTTTNGRKVRVRKQAASSDERLLHRRAKRQARLAAMTPVERKAWQEKRKERRKANRLARAQRK